GVIERLHRGFESVDLVDDLADRGDITVVGRAEQALGKASKHEIFLGMRMKWRRSEPRKLSETGPIRGGALKRRGAAGAIRARGRCRSASREDRAEPTCAPCRCRSTGAAAECSSWSGARYRSLRPCPSFRPAGPAPPSP